MSCKGSSLATGSGCIWPAWCSAHPIIDPLSVVFTLDFVCRFNREDNDINNEIWEVELSLFVQHIPQMLDWVEVCETSR